MKKIINSPETVVAEFLSGLVYAHPELALDSQYKIITRSQKNADKVNLISGGGSGHEPAHAGFVGQGMLDAAVCGDVFASPSQIQIYKAIQSCASSKGTLLIVKNYSGDIMNFRNAAYLAAEDGLQVDYVKVDDDIAVQDSLYTVGRRGVAGTVFVHKIAGAAAEQGMSLEEVKTVAEKAVRQVRSLGFAYTSCTVPAKGTPTFALAEDEMEFGVGIHGEPGIRRERILSADALAHRMVADLLKDLGITEHSKAELALLVNGFGATPLQELYVLTQSVARELDQVGLSVQKTLVGNFMTSLDMTGASISILVLDAQLKELLLAPCDTPAIKMTGSSSPSLYQDRSQVLGKTAVNHTKLSDAASMINAERLTLENIQFAVERMSQFIIENEVSFCDLDSHAGDGDFGMSLAKGFKQLRHRWNDLLAEQSQSIGDFLSACSLVIMEHCGGASGPIWGSAFRAAGRFAKGKMSLSLQDYSDLIQAAVTGIQVTGERSFGRGAQIGDKTLMDALIPYAQAITAEAQAGGNFADAFRKGTLAAQMGAESTKHIVARMGRAGTVGERSLGYPDAGAHALGLIFADLSNAFGVLA